MVDKIKIINRIDCTDKLTIIGILRILEAINQNVDQEHKFHLSPFADDKRCLLLYMYSCFDHGLNEKYKDIDYTHISYYSEKIEKSSDEFKKCLEDKTQEFLNITYEILMRRAHEDEIIELENNICRLFTDG